MEATKANPQAAIGVITDGTRRVLELASRSGVRRFLFTSTGAVYGRQPPELERIPESYSGKPDPTDLKSVYAVSGEAKRQAELLCLAQGDGLGAVIARCFTFSGPGLPLDGKFAFGNFLRDALEGVPIQLTGDGTPVRSYLYAADLTLWLWTLLLRGATGRAYNVGSEDPVTLRSLAETMAAELESPGIQVLRQPAPGAPPDRYVPSTARARGELGLRETFNLKDIIRRTAAWHRTPLKR
jgi:dTDP-glucose 4,6-dehydratase